MKVLMVGDIEAKPGRNAVAKYLPEIRKKMGIDFILLNVDNAAGGFGITANIAKEFFEYGADILTGGNHVFDQNGAPELLENEKRVLRPYNLPSNVPGRGVREVTTKNGKKVVIIHLIGQKNMPMIGSDPFDCANKLLSKYSLGKNADVILIDFHAEITSEKNALGHFVDGRVSAIVGTHTHIPTADERILEYGTAFQTDLGMTGDYDSIIGMRKDTAVLKYSKIHTRIKFSSALGEATFCGLIVETDDSTGLATSVIPVRLGGKLSQTQMNL